MTAVLVLAAVFIGTASAYDGDSIRLDGGPRLRMASLDAPELAQTCFDGSGHAYPAGVAARDHLLALIAGRPVTCEGVRADPYGRQIVSCTAQGDRETLNARMVADGWAWADYGRAYLPEEIDARVHGLGIWQGPCEVPKAWRREHGIGIVGRRR